MTRKTGVANFRSSRKAQSAPRRISFVSITGSRTTPAVAAGLEEKPWSLEKVVEMPEPYWRQKKRRANRRVAVAVRPEINVHSLGRLSPTETGSDVGIFQEKALLMHRRAIRPTSCEAAVQEQRARSEAAEKETLGRLTSLGTQTSAKR